MSGWPQKIGCECRRMPRAAFKCVPGLTTHHSQHSTHHASHITRHTRHTTPRMHYTRHICPHTTRNSRSTPPAAPDAIKPDAACYMAESHECNPQRETMRFPYANANRYAKATQPHHRIIGSATGTRTRVARVGAEYPNQLDYSGSCSPDMRRCFSTALTAWMNCVSEADTQ